MENTGMNRETQRETQSNRIQRETLIRRNSKQDLNAEDYEKLKKH